ncbi:methyltransferase domain-containing protein [Fundidesulfovibrio butyratiphilus]
MCNWGESGILFGRGLRPAAVVERHGSTLSEACRLGPVLDVAAGDGRNGLFLAVGGCRVVLVDASATSLALTQATARLLAGDLGKPLPVLIARLDLETDPPPIFAPRSLGAVLVLRYLHRPLIPVLRAALRPGGIMVCETFLEGGRGSGGSGNPAHFLRPGELARWFLDWPTLEAYEGPIHDPPGKVGRLVCRKPPERV